jgi:serine/threonine protein kinase
MEGKTYGNWNTGEVINDSSGNGVVWRASNATGAQFAIKVLKNFDSPAKAKKRRQRFENEISKLEMIKKLGIAGVMPILDHGTADSEEPWFVMPLARNLEPSGDRLVWALETMITVTQCIAELHTEGMVHRDIKPNNLLVLNGKVVVSDFGLARITDDDDFTKTGEGVGSFGYIAPESVGHSDEPQFKRDVYALAKTAWVLFSGASSPPNGELRHPDDSLVTRGIVSSGIPLVRLDELLIASTARDPADRPTARLFLDGLQSCHPSSKNPELRKSGSPAGYVKSLFASQAAKNHREKQSKELFQSLVNEAVINFFGAWGSVIENLGWSTGWSSGGSLGNHARQLGADWENSRNFFKGEINEVEYEIALTFGRLQTRGEARLVCRATIAIQVADDEHVLSSIERETYTSGPQTDQVRQALLAFVGSEETLYRAIEKLKQLSII